MATPQSVKLKSWGMQPEIFENNIGEPVLRRALSIR